MAVIPLCLLLPDDFQLVDGLDVFGAAHGLLGTNEGIDFQDAAFMSIKVNDFALLFHFIKSTETENFAKAVQLANICVQIKILE